MVAQAEIPDDVSRIRYKVGDLPSDWRNYPPPETLAYIGSDFVREGQAAIMIVPSALATVENNWLFNPAHPDFRRVKVLGTRPFQYDPRLFRVRTTLSILLFFFLEACANPHILSADSGQSA